MNWRSIEPCWIFCGSHSLASQLDILSSPAKWSIKLAAYTCDAASTREDATKSCINGSSCAACSTFPHGELVELNIVANATACVWTAGARLRRRRTLSVRGFCRRECPGMNIISTDLDIESCRHCRGVGAKSCTIGLFLPIIRPATLIARGRWFYVLGNDNGSVWSRMSHR